MTEFILNNDNVVTDLPTGTILLDFIRKEKLLPGTKIGCREGDCGACTVLAGVLNDDNKVIYSTLVSCLTPLANVQGMHIVTIEGLNLQGGLTPIQSSFVNNNATQCGFCTPGFIVSLTGYSFSENISIEGIYESVSGNICRCTGYNSIKKAGMDIFKYLNKVKNNGNISELIKFKIMPEYFEFIPNRLKKIPHKKTNKKENLVAGGTDLYVTNAQKLQETSVQSLTRNIETVIAKDDKEFVIGAGATASDIENNIELQHYFPNLSDYFKLISSKQIRNMGTLGGNLVNASPIADLAIFFLALDSRIELSSIEIESRIIPLRDFFKSYKDIDLQDNEIVKQLRFHIPHSNSKFNYEKVSKRTHLDIASVVSAISISVNNGIIKNINISAGGVSPIPLFLKNTSAFLTGKELTAQNIRKAHCVLKEEISPISDVRGSEEYKRLLLKQLYYTHFIKLFPEKIKIGDINK